MENQETVSEWFLAQTGGHVPSLLRAVKRIKEELIELEEEVASEYAFEPLKVGEELADVVITCLVAALVAGVDLQHYIDAKMLVNRHREWRMTSDFALYHVKENGPIHG